MTPSDVLTELRARGARVALMGNRIRVEGPRGTVDPPLRTALERHAHEIAALLRTGQLHGDDELAYVWSRFAEHGTQPAPDDLTGALHLERQRAWCTATLDDLYRGHVTLAATSGHLCAFPRTLQ